MESCSVVFLAIVLAIFIAMALEPQIEDDSEMD